MLAESDEAILRVTATLDALGVPYFIGGSVASALHGIPRLTNDVDLVAEIRTDQVPALVADLEAEFYVDADMIREAIAAHGSFNVIYLRMMIKVDVFLPPTSPWRESEWRRRGRHPLGADRDGPSVYFASAEDMALQKLEWYRLTGSRSERQWGDVQGILRVQAERLDLGYLRRWANELGIADLLQQALQEAGLE